MNTTILTRPIEEAVSHAHKIGDLPFGRSKITSIEWVAKGNNEGRWCYGFNGYAARWVDAVAYYDKNYPPREEIKKGDAFVAAEPDASHTSFIRIEALEDQPTYGKVRCAAYDRQGHKTVINVWPNTLLGGGRYVRATQ